MSNQQHINTNPEGRLFGKPSLRKLAAMSSAAIGLALGASLLSAPVQARDLCNNFNTDGVTNPPRAQTYCGLPSAAGQTATYHVTQLVTYHYNAGRGAAPGMISLRGTNGRMYSFLAHDDAGRRGLPSYNWIADVNMDVPADNYAVIDSDWNSWSNNARSGGWGFAIVRGDQVSATPLPSRLPPTVVATPGFTPLPNGQFCLHPYQPGSFADTYPCTGPTRAGTMTITMRLRRPIAAVPGQVVFTLANVASLVQFRGPVTGATGTGVNSDLTVAVPAALCAYPGREFTITLPNYGAVGRFFPDCR
ncbi:MAG: hypothetical protein ACJ798_06840 [Phenylobacterium sp.]